MNARQRRAKMERQVAWFAEDRKRVEEFNKIDPQEARARARATDPASSHRAAMAITLSGKAGRQQAEILEALKRYDGSTSRELAELSGLSLHVIGRRMPELERKGLIRRVACEGQDLRCFVVLKPAPLAQEIRDERLCT